jgi:crotonobetainyl-CoA:carnitine CoA-transferase CaiB-like acyl-CoA transferase
MVVMCNKEKFFHALCQAIGAPHLAKDARYVNFQSRLEHKDALIAELFAIFQTEPTAYWLEKMKGMVPAAPVNSVEQAMKQPLLRERNMIVEVEHASMGRLQMVGTPIKVSGFAPNYRAAPVLGGDNEDVYRTILGLSRQEIEDLKTKKII